MCFDIAVSDIEVLWKRGSQNLQRASNLGKLKCADLGSPSLDLSPGFAPHRLCDPGHRYRCHSAMPRSGITSHAGLSLLDHLFDAVPKEDIANQSESNNKNIVLVYHFIIHLNRLLPESSTEPSGLVAKR